MDMPSCGQDEVETAAAEPEKADEAAAADAVQADDASELHALRRGALFTKRKEYMRQDFLIPWEGRWVVEIFYHNLVSNASDPAAEPPSSSSSAASTEPQETSRDDAAAVEPAPCKPTRKKSKKTKKNKEAKAASLELRSGAAPNETMRRFFSRVSAVTAISPAPVLSPCFPAHVISRNLPRRRCPCFSCSALLLLPACCSPAGTFAPGRTQTRIRALTGTLILLRRLGSSELPNKALGLAPPNADKRDFSSGGFSEVHWASTLARRVLSPESKRLSIEYEGAAQAEVPKNFTAPPPRTLNSIVEQSAAGRHVSKIGILIAPPWDSIDVNVCEVPELLTSTATTTSVTVKTTLSHQWWRAFTQLWPVFSDAATAVLVVPPMLLRPERGASRFIALTALGLMAQGCLPGAAADQFKPEEMDEPTMNAVAGRTLTETANPSPPPSPPPPSAQAQPPNLEKARAGCTPGCADVQPPHLASSRLISTLISPHLR